MDRGQDIAKVRLDEGAVECVGDCRAGPDPQRVREPAPAFLVADEGRASVREQFVGVLLRSPVVSKPSERLISASVPALSNFAWAWKSTSARMRSG